MQIAPPVRGLAPTVDTRPLDPTVAGRLTLTAPDPTGHAHVSAASSLVAAGGAAWIVSDSYGSLVKFGSLAAPGTLLPGLPEGAKRPDLEALVRVPDAQTGGSLLVAFGSGSKNDRQRAFSQLVSATGEVVGPPVAASLTPLYTEFDRRLPLQPNIEGIALRDGAKGAELLVFHRGKLDGDVNTIFRLDAARVLAALRAGQPVPADTVLGQTSLDLGTLGGARLGFADAQVLPDGRIAFTASSEGNDATGDGVIFGSVVGILGADLAVQVMRPLTGPARKVEGLERTSLLDPTASPTSFTLVTDPDDPTQAAEVLTVDLG